MQRSFLLRQILRKYLRLSPPETAQKKSKDTFACAWDVGSGHQQSHLGPDGTDDDPFHGLFFHWLWSTSMLCSTHTQPPSTSFDRLHMPIGVVQPCALSTHGEKCRASS